MANGKTIDVGNFSQGIISDVIGANDSMLSIIDGWVPRTGEIRKRGGKTLFEAHGTARRAGAKATDLAAGSDAIAAANAGFGYGYAFVGGGEWLVQRFPDANSTLLSASTNVEFFPPFTGLTPVPHGGGDQIKNFGNILISTGLYDPLTAGNVMYMGAWGGAIIDRNVTDLGVTLTQGSTEATGTLDPNDFPIGSFLSIGRGAAPVPNPDAKYMVISAQTDKIVLDRPWPGATDSNYQLLPRTALTRLGDPHDTGVNGARAIEAHQDRFFAANFDPAWVLDGNDATERQRLKSRLRWSASWGENGTGALTLDGASYGEHLWYPAAYVDVFPGQGGAITGLHSLGNALIIVKEDAVYALRGSVNSKGRPSGSSLDVISLESGSSSYRGSAKTELGVAWVNSRGLWVYNGGQVVNLVDGAVERQWTEVLGTDLTDVVVSGCNDRIIVQVPGNDDCWVYYSDRQHFVRQRTNSCTNVVPFGDSLFGDIELAVDDVTGNIIDWSSDFTEDNDEDSENASYPRLEVTTADLPGDKMPFLTARPNILMIAGQFDVEMTASVDFGRSTPFDTGLYLETDTQVGVDATQPLEYGVKIDPKDVVNRIGIGGVASRPTHRFTFTQADPANVMRIYGIGVEYSEDYTVDNDDD